MSIGGIGRQDVGGASQVQSGAEQAAPPAPTQADPEITYQSHPDAPEHATTGSNYSAILEQSLQRGDRPGGVDPTRPGPGRSGWPRRGSQLVRGAADARGCMTLPPSSLQDAEK